MNEMSSTALPISRGLRGRCPACGQGKLFKGFLGLRAACDKCGLDYRLCFGRVRTSLITAGNGLEADAHS